MAVTKDRKAELIKQYGKDEMRFTHRFRLLFLLVFVSSPTT